MTPRTLKRIVRKKSFPRIIETRQNGVRYFILDSRQTVAGIKQGGRNFFKTYAEASEEATNIEKGQFVQGKVDVRGDVKALAILAHAKEEFKKLDLDLVQGFHEFLGYAKRLAARKNDNRIEKVWNELISFGERQKRSGRTIDGYKRFKKLMLNHFSNQPVGWLAHEQGVDLGPNKVMEFLYSGKLNLDKNTIDNIRIGFKKFFNFCIKQGYLRQNENPLALAPRDRDPTYPKVISADDAEKILRAAEEHDPKIAAVFALLIFAGLRPGEAENFEPSQIKFEDKKLVVAGQTSKKGKTREVTLEEPLIRWLKAYPDFDTGKRRKRMEKIRNLAGFAAGKKQKDLKPWQNDILRHTSIGMMLKKTNFAYGRVAEEHGNTEIVIRNHYKGIMPSEEEVKKFYNIYPSKKSKNKKD